MMAVKPKAGLAAADRCKMYDFIGISHSQVRFEKTILLAGSGFLIQAWRFDGIPGSSVEH